MKQNALLLTAIVGVLFLASCQKEASDPGNTAPGVSLKIKTYTEDLKSPTLGNSVATYNLSYDGSDRIISMIDAANPGNKFVFTYPSASKFTMEILNNNAFEIHVDYFLNSQSLLDSSFQYNNTQDSSTEKYVYNATKQVTRLYEYDYSKVTGSSLWKLTDYKYDGSGNLIEAKDSDGWVTTYEYHADKKNVLPEVLPFHGSKASVYLPKQSILKIPGITPVVVTYTYTFDNKDRISSVKEEGSNVYTILKTYTYFD